MVAARMARQQMLTEPRRPELQYLIEEATLTWRVGSSETMRAQLHHLLRLTSRPKITVQVVPFSAGAPPGMNGSFVIFDSATEPSVAYLESRGTSTFIEEAEHVEKFQYAWRTLTSLALSFQDSAAAITKAIETWSPVGADPADLQPEPGHGFAARVGEEPRARMGTR